MTVIEYDAAWRGYAERHGLGRGQAGMSRRRLEELKRLYPDAPADAHQASGA
jgi:hypothetical protein